MSYSEYSISKAAIRLLGGESEKKEIQLTPQEVISRALQKAAEASTGIRCVENKPGALIESMSEEEREALKKCESKDWNHRNDIK
jgi:hypothetical protein